MLSFALYHVPPILDDKGKTIKIVPVGKYDDIVKKVAKDTGISDERHVLSVLWRIADKLKKAHGDVYLELWVDTVYLVLEID
jgi:hypothetical protein